MIKSAAEFVRICFSLDSDERCRAIRENASKLVWLELIADDRPEVRWHVANNRTIPESVIRHLAVDANWRVRWRIASKRSTPESVLRTLATDSEPAVRMAVATNRRTAPTILKVLSDDPDDDIRSAARERCSAG